MNGTSKDKKRKANPYTEAELADIRQNSEYSENGKAAPDNNIFHDGKSNPLSSKGG